MNLYRTIVNKLRRESGAGTPAIPRQRRDLEVFVVDANIKYQVYWKKNRNGFGTVMIVLVKNREIAKFDCLGGANGHYHISPSFDFRILFPEDPVSEQIDRSILELKENLHRYLARHPSGDLNSITIPNDKFDEQVELAHQRMKYLLETIPGMK
jgi:hypothetical protein